MRSLRFSEETISPRSPQVLRTGAQAKAEPKGIVPFTYFSHLNILFAGRCLTPQEGVSSGTTPPPLKSEGLCL